MSEVGGAGAKSMEDNNIKVVLEVSFRKELENKENTGDIEKSKDKEVLVDKEILEVTLAGLFHDIGKINGIKGHANISASYVKNFIKDPDNIIAKAIELHHEKPAKILQHAKQAERKNMSDKIIKYVAAVKIADWLSASMRMIEEEEKQTLVKVKGLSSPFPQERGDKLWYKKCCSGKEIEDQWQVIYPIVYRSPLLKNLPKTLPDFITRLYDVLFIKGKFTDDTRDRSIPLAVHLHLTAALASALYANDYFRENILTEKFLNKAYENKGALPEIYDSGDPVIKIIGMDIHRIQSFIYGLKSESGAIRHIAGRSFLINILTRVLPAMVAIVYGVTPVNVIMASGGKAYIIVPYKKDINLKKLEESINNVLRRNNINVIVSLKDVDISLRAIMETIAETRKSHVLVEKLIKDLKRRLETELDYQEYEAVKRESSLDNLCEICGEPLEDNTSENICRACQLSEKLREILIERTRKIVKEEEIVEISFNNFNYKIFLTQKKYDELKKRDESENKKCIFIFSISDENNEGAIPKPAYYKMDGEGRVTSFEKLSEGFLGVIKADADNMGIIFDKISKEEVEVEPRDSNEKSGEEVQAKLGLARLITLSQALGWFFEREIPKIVKKEVTEKGKNVHLIFAGGDDLLMVGNQRDVLEVFDKIIEEFEKYKRGGWCPEGEFKGTFLPTISAGYFVFPEKYKFKWAVERVEELLNTAKQVKKSPFRKNNITYHSDIFIDDMKNIPERLKDVKLLTEALESGKLSQTLFYRIAIYFSDIIDLALRERPFRDRFRRYVSFVHYVKRLEANDRLESLVDGLLDDAFTLTKSKQLCYTPVHFIPFLLTYLVTKNKRR